MVFSNRFSNRGVGSASRSFDPMPQCRRVIQFMVLLFGTSVLSTAQSPEIADIFARATQAMQEGHIDEAGVGFAAVVKQAPTFAEAHFNLGLVRQEQGRFEEAAASFQRSIALKPHLHGANLFLGISEFRLNRMDAAVAAIKK